MCSPKRPLRILFLASSLRSWGPQRSGAGSTPDERMQGGGCWKGQRERQEVRGRPRREARERKKERDQEGREEEEGQRKGGKDQLRKQGARRETKNWEWRDGARVGCVRTCERTSIRSRHGGNGAEQPSPSMYSPRSEITELEERGWNLRERRITRCGSDKYSCGISDWAHGPAM